jgi:hypothetical protein
VPVFLVLCCEFHFTALRIGYRVLRVTARESKAFLLDFLLSSLTTGRIPLPGAAAAHDGLAGRSMFSTSFDVNFKALRTT